MGYSAENNPSLPEITPADAGCWLDGAMGWHNTYRVIERAQAYGFTITKEEQGWVDRYAEDGLNADDYAEAVMEISNDATDYLQSRAPEGYEFVWDMGELSLQQIEEDE